MSEALNTFGLKPGKTDWQLFQIDGWPLLIEQGPNENGDGFGIHYKTTVAGLDDMVISAWIGNPADNDKTADAFAKAFEEIDEEKARVGLQMLLDQAGPLLASQVA